MPLFLKNLLFRVVVPGTVAVYLPVLAAGGREPAGTPAPVDAPRRLVVRGLYRLTHDPMYVGVLGVILGWVIVFRSAGLLLYAMAVWGMLHAHLRRTFGAEYEAYCARIGRWPPRLDSAWRW